MIRAMNHFRNERVSVKVAEANRHQWFIAAREEKRRKTQLADQADDDFLDLVTSVILATEFEVQQFRTRLDKYDEATVAALMENQQALDAVRERLANMLSRAHVLGDGRRVFKTGDGTQVFDEHGSQLDETIIHPDQIDDNKPRWEAFQQELQTQQQLIQERRDLHEYQQKLDEARERSGPDDITKSELDDLDKDLMDAMPTAVRRQIPGFEASETIPAVKSEFTARANPVVPVAPVQTGPEFTPAQ